MKKKFLLFSFFFLLSSCVTAPEFVKQPSPSKTALKSSTAEIQLFKEAKNTLSQNPKASLVKLNEIAKNSSGTDTYFESLILMGRILEREGRKDEAIKAYKRIITSNYNHPKRAFAYFRIANIYKAKGETKEALKYTSAGLAQNDVSPKDQVIFNKFQYPLLIETDEFGKALNSMDFVVKNSKNETAIKDAQSLSANLIRIRLNRDQLQKLIEDPSLSNYHGQAYAKLGETAFYSGQTEEASQYFEKALEMLPTGAVRQRISEMKRFSSVYKNVSRNTIGVIIPLSGPRRAIGENILRGLKIGMESGSGNYKLIIKDSRAEEVIAKQLADELIRENGVMAIIGGATGATASAIVSVTSRFGVPAIVLTPKPGIAEEFDFTFQNAFPLKFAAEQTALYVLANTEYNRIGVIKPDDTFGNAYSDAFVQTLIDNGKEVSDVVSYTADEKRSLNDAVKSLVKINASGERKNEYNQKLRLWRKNNKNARRLNDPSVEELLKPLIDFDAVFIADSAKTSALVAATLPYYDIEETPLIGTHLWNSPELVKRAPKQVEGSIFIDYLPPSGQWPSNFCTRKISESLGNLEPNLFSVLGYDSAKLIKTALASGPTHRVALKENLENIKNIPGCLGNLSLDQSRVVSRPVFKLKVKDGRIIINNTAL